MVIGDQVLAVGADAGGTKLMAFDVATGSLNWEWQDVRYEEPRTIEFKETIAY